MSKEEKALELLKEKGLKGYLILIMDGVMVTFQYQKDISFMKKLMMSYMN